MMKTYPLILALLLSLPLSAQPTTTSWKNTSLSFHERAKAVVTLMTLDEKINQVGHATLSIDRPALQFPGYHYWCEALHGVARSGKATSFPSSKAMSSTWNPQLIFDCAKITSDEARIYANVSGKGLTYWCPTINMSRDPRWGRDEENYGEDPFLAGTLAVHYIKGMQGDNQGISSPYYKSIATVKHYAANNYERGRHSTSSDVTMRNLREYYLPAFEMSVRDANCRSVMSAYNAVNGIPCGANEFLLQTILRDEWGFTGFVTSDCGAVRDVFNKHHYVKTAEEASALSMKAGEDLNCGTVFQEACKSAIEKGLMTEADIDTALVRILEARFSVGEFDDAKDVAWRAISADLLECDAHVQKSLEAAHQAIVLLKNKHNILPLDRSKSVAVIGPLSREVNLGGYSGSPTKLINPLDGIAKKIGYMVNDGTMSFVHFDHSNVAPSSKRLAVEANGADGALSFINDGDWVAFNQIDFAEGRSVIELYASSRDVTSTVDIFLDQIDETPEATLMIAPTGSWNAYRTFIYDVDPAVFRGNHRVFFRSTYINGKGKYCANLATIKFSTPNAIDPLQDKGPLYYVKGCSVTSNSTKGDKSAGAVGVNADAYKTNLEAAVAVAKKADYVVFVGGTNLAVSDESHDRESLGLPGDQQLLLEAVFAVNPNVILVLESCGSMAINWAETHVPAIVEAWYGGQQQGQAIADVLYGDYNPGGKLTSTWYDVDAYNMPPLAQQSYNIDEAKLTYLYHDKKPLYPFGYGLSYTTFDYANLQLSANTFAKGNVVMVNVDVKNTGQVDGDEIVQVYAHCHSRISRPQKQLVGFQRVSLKAGETKTVSIPVRHQQLAYFNEKHDAFEVEAGKVDIHVAASAEDVRLTATVRAKAENFGKKYLSK